LLSASQKPSDPSPVASFGGSVSPLALRSSSNAAQLVSLSRWPSIIAISSFFPSSVAPIKTSTHGRSSLSRQPK